jgi:hypothetical protein
VIITCDHSLRKFWKKEERLRDDIYYLINLFVEINLCCFYAFSMLKFASMETKYVLLNKTQICNLIFNLY